MRHRAVGAIISIVGLIIIILAGYWPVATGLLLFTLGNGIYDTGPEDEG